MADPIFEHPRLVAIYDALDPDRGDLDVYAAIVKEFGARRVLDVGCGTGTFALLLAGAGLEVTGVDPAAGSLEVARAKPGAERVRWIHGDATTLPLMQVDLATMTGNVAQAIVDPLDWAATLRGVYDDVGGALVSFRWTWVFASDGAMLTSDSTLRFRERDEVEAELLAHGYTVDDARGAPDRPGHQFVFIASRPR